MIDRPYEMHKANKFKAAAAETIAEEFAGFLPEEAKPLFVGKPLCAVAHVSNKYLSQKVQ